MATGGQKLRALREQLGWTMRDVETRSARIAEKRGNEEYAIPPSRLSDIETKGLVPSIYRLYTLALLYRRNIPELLRWYGIELHPQLGDFELAPPPKSHVSQALSGVPMAQVPVRMDPSFDTRLTSNLGRLVEQWGLVPMAYLQRFANCEFTYGYIGTQDLTMFPILPPGTFVQVDESRNRVVEGGWRSEYERPIYFVETRNGYTCCWCSLSRDEIILQPHPLSPVPARALKYPQQAEVIGQVVGAAMRLGDWRPLVEPEPDQKERAALN